MPVVRGRPVPVLSVDLVTKIRFVRTEHAKTQAKPAPKLHPITTAMAIVCPDLAASMVIASSCAAARRVKTAIYAVIMAMVLNA